MYRIKTDRKKKHRTRAIPRPPARAYETETGKISVTGLETGEEERGTIERGRAIQRRPEREATLSRRGRKRGKETVYQGVGGGETPQRQWGSFDSRANWNAADANDDGTHRGLGYPLWPGVGGSRGVLASTGVTQG